MRCCNGHHLGGLSLHAVCAPRLYELAPFIKKVTPSVSSLHSVWDFVGQCHFGDLAWEGRPLGGPVSERTPEAVRRGMTTAHPTHQHRKRHIAQWSPGFRARKDVGAKPNLLHLFY